MTIHIAPTRDITTCRHLRRVVFIEEQGVPEEDEIDDKDDTALHLLATENDTPVGSARLLLQGKTGKIGRVCVLKSHRGTGLGAALIRAALTELRAQGMTTAKLGSQTHAIGFYERLGFTATGPEYMDAGIPHRDMVLTL
ncbi:GNAT family N-acetyltransferase [Fuscovulum ytuae]|uniref:GNAT family N-acetyltransferase n=1 Tax=Fuscovulum ytuae TaxID=3042299 RepID=A0ABY8Q5Z3_9RHOB|nr:GNAT family N-acetyltransferase [Fuscovulum sp. YMD61]WGV15602.1 GNAT family N-acetyltransferase [Fuscovulum sp. YMD61]